MIPKAPLDTIDNDIDDADVSIDLARKYRPLTWDAMLGQKATIRGLRQSVISHDVPAAYLFSGKHGCGKTTAAFILARALNCPNVDDSGNPCNQCDVCKSITMDSTVLGFNYQAASNATNIDSVREIIRASYMKSPMKHPVWILDEFQALQKSAGAYDEFLNPLENGTPTTFIFCTTEINKINKPALLSRCRKFTFGDVDIREMIPFMVSIMRNEGYDVIQDGDKRTERCVTRGQILSAINGANGSVRDALSRLSAIIMSGESIGVSAIDQLLSAVFVQRSIGAAITVLKDAATRGDDMQALATLFAQSCTDAAQMADGYNNDSMTNPLLRKIARLFPATVFSDAMTTTGEALSNMAWGTADGQLFLEISAIRIIRDLPSA